MVDDLIISASPDKKDRYEIVLPAFKNNEVALVLDVDSDKPAAFNEHDERGLARVIKIIERLL